MCSTPKLNQDYIKQAKLTAFRATSIDVIVRDYEKMANEININIKKDKGMKLNKLCELYNNYLYALGNHVSPWVAGGSNYKRQSTSPIDKGLEKITNYVETIEKELKEIDYQKNKQKYDNQKRKQNKISLINKIGYFQDINKALFYESLVELYDLDKDTFIKVYNVVGNKIADNSKPAKLYSKIMKK